MKTGLFAFLVILGAICIVYGAGPFIVDDFEDGDPLSIHHGWWYTYTDSSSGGNSTIKPPQGRFTVNSPGAENTKYCARMSGTTGNKLGWDFIGLGCWLSNETGCPQCKAIDCSAYRFLQFKMKGRATAGRLVVKILYMSDSCDRSNQSCATLTEWADYEAALTGKLTTEWTAVKLDLHKDFRQPAWTKANLRFSIEKVLRNAKGLQWHFSSPDGDSIDVLIDDIQFTE
jgi:hypothetical protein